MLQQETLNYSFVCIYLLATIFCFYVFMFKQEIEEFLLGLISKVTGVDIKMITFSSRTEIAVASKAALATIKAFLFLHGVLAAMLFAGVIVELI